MEGSGRRIAIVAIGVVAAAAAATAAAVVIVNLELLTTLGIGAVSIA